MNHRLENLADKTQAVAIQVMVGTLAAALNVFVAGARIYITARNRQVRH